jgi:hypothetical protein
VKDDVTDKCEDGHDTDGGGSRRPPLWYIPKSSSRTRRICPLPRRELQWRESCHLCHLPGSRPIRHYTDSRRAHSSKEAVFGPPAFPVPARSNAGASSWTPRAQMPGRGGGRWRQRCLQWPLHDQPARSWTSTIRLRAHEARASQAVQLL